MKSMAGSNLKKREYQDQMKACTLRITINKNVNPQKCVGEQSQAPYEN